MNFQFKHAEQGQSKHKHSVSSSRHRKTWLIRVLALLALYGALWQTTPAQAANGDLDPTFDTDGKVMTQFAGGESFDVITAMTLQTDGKILVAGYTNESPNLDFAVARYNTNGSLDNTFSDDGKQSTDFSGANDLAYGIKVQSDGKIIVVGQSDSGEARNFALVRYNDDGSLDNTFSGDGKQITDFDGNDDIAYAVTLQSNGYIIVAGSATINSTTDFAVARYDTDGDLDNTFSGDGKQTTDFNGYTDVARAVTLQSDGKILLAGYAYAVDTGVDYAVIRYNTDGDLDNTFSGDGKQTTTFVGNDSWGYNDYAYSITLQSDGRILLAGNAIGGNPEVGLVRYLSDGSLDNSFDSDGKVTTDFYNGNDFATAIVVQSSGKILVGGYGSSDNFENSFDFFLARYNSNGTLDTSFSGDGKQNTDFNQSYDRADAMVVQSDGKVVLAGSTESEPTSYDFSLARYIVFSNEAPIANAGPDQSVPQLGITTPVTLNGSASTDADGDSLTYTWRENGSVITSGATPTVYLTSGTHTIELTVSDGEFTSTDTVVISVSIPAATLGAQVMGTGYFSGESSVGQTSFTVVQSQNKVIGSLYYQDKTNKVTISVTSFTSVFVQGNMSRIYGTAKVNGAGNYLFILTAQDNTPFFFNRGDRFRIEVANGYNSGLVAFTQGDVRVLVK